MDHLKLIDGGQSRHMLKSPGGHREGTCYHVQGKKSWDEVPDPTLPEQADAIVHVGTTTICGTNLHILKGDMPAVSEGRILGHEGEWRRKQLDAPESGYLPVDLGDE